jgi:hypothetical protein
MRFDLRLLGVCLVASVAACGTENPTNLVNDGNGSGNGSDGTPVVAPSYAQDVFPPFVRRGCTTGSCHGGDAGGLTMSTSQDTYENLVGVPASKQGELLVVAGDAAGSYLVKKLEGAPGVGAQMPIGRAPLSAAELGTIRNWINQGALKN